ncbi:MAG TPA: EamA family transporter [Egibacteraceae bacterium]|nr:EamA family transporter [Egibacteraceae bacterium]
MTAILGGLGAALAFAIATVCSARSSRLIGAAPVLGWVMLIGLAITIPLLVVAGPVHIPAAILPWLAISGAANVLGLLAVYRALRSGKVGIVTPIVATEGAVAAVIAVIAGEHLTVAVTVTLAIIAAGIVAATAAGAQSVSPAPATAPVSARARRRRAPVAPPMAETLPGSRLGRRAATLYAAVGAVSFGVSLFATAQVGAALPVAWAVLPARAVGVCALAIPLAATGRLRLTRATAPLVLAAAIAEVAGFASFAAGASGGVAVSSVLTSQFAPIAGLGGYLFFGERLTRRQLLAAAVIMVGVGVLAALPR